MTDWPTETAKALEEHIRRSGTKCGRLTRSTPQRPCSNFVTFADSCNFHLTVEEARAYRAADARARRRAIREMRWRDENDRPACWLWPIDIEDLPTLQQCLLQAKGRSATLDAAVDLLGGWQEGRCALCGRTSHLILDHDHDTGWIRGMLCTRCNVREGAGNSTVLAKYRERHPAAILGIGVLYYGPFTGWAATRVPGRDHDANPGAWILESVYYDQSGTRVLPPPGGA